MKDLIKEIQILADGLNQEEIEKVVELISKKNDSLIIGLGAGRMGYSLRAFVMRLTHLGFNAFMIGDTGLPRINEDSIILINTSSGETPTIKLYAEQAKNVGATIITFTTNSKSSIGLISNYVVEMEKYESNQLMKTLYEQFSFLLFDYIAEKIFTKMNLEKKWVEKNHSILE